jgi:hypothetical protein
LWGGSAAAALRCDDDVDLGVASALRGAAARVVTDVFTVAMRHGAAEADATTTGITGALQHRVGFFGVARFHRIIIPFMAAWSYRIATTD